MQRAAGRRKLSPFDRLVIAMNAVGTLWVLLLVLLMNTDALGRTFFSLPIAGAVEIVAISMALIVFCQLADTIRLGKLTRSDGFVEMWIAGGTRTGKGAAASMEILGAVFMGLIIAGTFPLMVKAYERGVYIGTRGVFSFPDWPIKAVVVAGATAAGLCFIVRAIRILSGKSPNPQ
jgi:TRAP-type mannitol/chloroaromatic compound transport system permease small subunit